MLSQRIQKVSLDKLTAKTCRESFFQFFLEFWPLVAAEKLVANWHIEYLCNELQIAAERVFRDQPKEYDLITNCPPGTSKSSIFSVLFPAWVWTRMPSARFITGSYAEALALDLSRKSRDVVQSDKYRRLFPEIQLKEDQNTKGYFANTKGGFRKATGVGGIIIGMHAHFIIIDDPIDPLGATSDQAINEANNWMGETVTRRKVDQQVSFTALVMQRLHQNDATGNWLERGGRVRQVVLPADDAWEIKPEELKQKYADQGGLLDPQRLPRSVLSSSEKELGETGYAGQYGQNPTPRGGAMFKVTRLEANIRDQAPDKYKRGPVRYWDKAATAGAGSYTVGVKMAIDELDRVWILDVQRFRLSSGDREAEILKTARGDGRKVRIGVEQEPGGGGKEAAETAARKYAAAGFRVGIDVVRATKEERAGGGENEHRADTFSVQVNTGNVYLLKAHWNRDFIEEYRFFPNSRFKDQVDAGSGAYGMLSRARLKIGAV